MTTTEQAFRGSAADAMLRAALLPCAAVCAGCIALSAWLAGTSGLWGAALGAVLVFAFCTLTLVVLGLTRGIDPVAALLLALALYTVKVVALGVSLVIIGRTSLLEDPAGRTALGLTVIAATLTWTILELVASVKHRQLLYDLGESR